MLSLDRVGEERLADWKSDVDLGDQVGRHRRGDHVPARRAVRARRQLGADRQVRCAPARTSTRALTDPEARVRQRYVDLVVNAGRPADAARRGLRWSPLCATSLRDRGFVEVETPHAAAAARRRGGAAVRDPHERARHRPVSADRDRSSTSSGSSSAGSPKVFEIDRNFRNEGVDTTHNPGVRDARGVRGVRRLQLDGRARREQVREWAIAAAQVTRSTVVPDGAGGEVDLAGRVAVGDRARHVVSEALGEEVTPDTASPSS